jgi:hypothetical protein
MNEIDLLGEKRPTPKFARAFIIILVISVIALVVLIGSQKPDSSTQDGANEFVIATEELASGQELVIGINNATLYVPKDALNLAGTITISPRPPNLFSLAEQSDWSRTLVVNVEYRNEAGTPYPLVTLSKPFQICFKVTSERWQDYTKRPDEYQVQYYNEEQESPGWEPVPMVTHPERNELCGEVDHFSLFALAIKKPPSAVPITGIEITPTPGPGGPFVDFLSSLFGRGSDTSSDGTGGVYEP